LDGQINSLTRAFAGNDLSGATALHSLSAEKKLKESFR